VTPGGDMQYPHRLVKTSPRKPTAAGWRYSYENAAEWPLAGFLSPAKL